MKSGLVVLSGGMDSAVLLYTMRGMFDRLSAITFDYGQRHHKEIDYARKLGDKVGVAEHRVVDLRVLRPLLAGSALTSSAIDVPDGHYTDISMKATVVPNRNAIMLSIAAGFAISQNIEAIGIAVHSGDHAIYPDCRPEFIKALSNAFSLGNYDCPIIFAPFIKMTKGDIAKAGVALGVDFRNTWSCYKGGDTHCGICGTCVERQEALREAGIA